MWLSILSAHRVFYLKEPTRPPSPGSRSAVDSVTLTLVSTCVVRSWGFLFLCISSSQHFLSLSVFFFFSVSLNLSVSESHF